MASIPADWQTIQPLLEEFVLYVLGMTLYCLWVFSFDKHVSRRLLFKYVEPDSAHPLLRRRLSKVLYALKFLFLSPLLLFGWSVVITLFIFMLTGDLPLDRLLLFSTALLATVRITAYYNQTLSQTVLHAFSMWLLVAFIITPQAATFELLWMKIQHVPEHLFTFLFYFAVTVLLEFLLRVYDAIANRE